MIMRGPARRKITNKRPLRKTIALKERKYHFTAYVFYGCEKTGHVPGKVMIVETRLPLLESYLNSTVRRIKASQQPLIRLKFTLLYE